MVVYKSQQAGWADEQKKKLAAHQAKLKQQKGTALPPVQRSAVSSATVPSLEAQRMKIAGYNPATGKAEAGKKITPTYQTSVPGTVGQNYTVNSLGGVVDERGRVLSTAEKDRLGGSLGWEEVFQTDPRTGAESSFMAPNLANAKLVKGLNADNRTQFQSPSDQEAWATYARSLEAAGRTGTSEYSKAVTMANKADMNAPTPTSGLQFGNDLTGATQAYADSLTGGAPAFGQTGTGGSTPSLSTDLTPPMPIDSKGTTTTRGTSVSSYFELPAGTESEDTARYQRELEQYKLAEDQAKENYDTLKNKYTGETNDLLKQWDSGADTKYGQLMDTALENTKRTTEEMMRFKGAKGTTRSSRTMDAIKIIQDKGSEVQNNILTERDAARRVYEMQLAGIEGDALAPYEQALSDATTKRQGAEAVLLKAQQGLLLEQQLAGEEVRIKEEQQYLDSLKEIGMAVDPRTGEAVESLQGQLDRAKALKDTASAQKTLLEAAKLQKALDNDFEVKFTKDSGGNSVAVWYDPAAPGELQIADLGGAPVGGGGYGGGGGYPGGGGGVVPSDAATQDYIDVMAAHYSEGGYSDEGGAVKGSSWADVNAEVENLPVTDTTKLAILNETAKRRGSLGASAYADWGE